MNYKYVRIQGREDSYITKYPKGIFSLCWNLVNDGVMEQSENDLFMMNGLNATCRNRNHA